ncbi:RE1-silencing transcription factor B [Nilaparvata lugens]|uniref:RE1-silencing transcription factor B n=1 Tax=Nilaparvata lugens TaxID=108931 RepID=UPI00193E790E|nr:RE1-silencing transcription factor B [Nilaparvata lugens]XP_039297449.1 RE1-silencing transcription factor B [Nilaparvata lugens]
MDTENFQNKLQPTEECFIKQEIYYESTPPELQDDEVDQGEEVNPLLYPKIETQTCAHATQQEDSGKDPSSSIENEFLAQPGSSVWSSNDVSPIDTEVDELIVPDLIVHKRISTSKGREGIGEETSIGVDPLSIVSTSNINLESKRRKYDRKMEVIGPSDTNKPSSDFDPSSVVLPDMRINTSPNVGDSSTVVPISGGPVLDDPLTIAVNPHDYKSKDDPSSIVTDNSNLEGKPSSNQPSPVRSSDSKPSPNQLRDSDSSQGNSGTNYYPQLPINPNPKVTLLKCFFCKFSCFNATNFATHLSTHEQLLKCSHCNYETVKRHLLKKHTQKHFGKRFFDCDECEFKTSITENLVGHMTTKHAKKSVTIVSIVMQFSAQLKTLLII